MPEKRPVASTENVPYDLRERTFLFSVRILKWVRTLPHDTGTQVAVRQWMEAATSLGANVEKADGAGTARDRVYKWTLSRKEARRRAIGSASSAPLARTRLKGRPWSKRPWN